MGFDLVIHLESHQRLNFCSFNVPILMQAGLQVHLPYITSMSASALAVDVLFFTKQ